ncbi:MAG: NADH-quinone oxidoreductase subunit NuoB [Candidatus Omnitrophica bacterium]|nr:NADH-quinone oxidoreductase subunit NuoB [Candidatus Omnitrophota bacterium]
MFLKKSPWIIHYDGSSCNGCDIEVLACLTPLFDVERFGIINTGNPKHADIFLITGSVNEQNKEIIQNIYCQMPDPKVVVAIGICACSGGIFAECYNVLGGVAKVIPVDVFVPGCAARPESIIDGVVKGLAVLEEKGKKFKNMKKGLATLSIDPAQIQDSAEILALQKAAYQSEAELYNDFSLSPLNQSLEEIKADFKSKIFLKAVLNKVIVGSVRAYQEKETCHIGRLIVHPLYQNWGIGTKLLYAIEARFPNAVRYESFTGHKSKRTLYFGRKRGYRECRREKVSLKRERVFFEKTREGKAR